MISLIKIVANFLRKFSLKTYIYLSFTIALLYTSYKVYDAFQSKKKYVEVKTDLVISKNQIGEVQKLLLDYRNTVKALNFKIKSDSLFILEKNRQIIFRDSLLITKDNQIIAIQKLIKPIDDSKKKYKDSLDNLKDDYKKLLRKSNRKGLFGRNINNIA